ncbi:protein translocase subunit SecF, partial [Streptomyces sp. NPDC055709]
ADLKEREPAMKALKKRVLAKRAAAAARGESAEDASEDVPGEPQDALPGAAATAGAVVGQRGRGRGRPSSGKRR